MCTILVAGDDTKTRNDLKEFLSEEGYKVLIAKDGLSAFNIAILNHPDLIISDIKMPHLDGFEVLMALQLNSNTSAIPMIFITGDSEKQKAKLGISLGAKGYFIKPFELTDLLKSIKKLQLDKPIINNTVLFNK